MGIGLVLRDMLQDPRLRDVDAAGEEGLRLHAQVLQEKQLMRDVFVDFYRMCMAYDDECFRGVGKRVEIGAGTSFFKKIYPDVISTDVKEAEHLDMVVDAQNMPFEDRSVRAIYGMNCFHHFPNPAAFFDELIRVLVPGGGCVLIEPYFGFIARNFYKVVHRIEGFDQTQEAWTSIGADGRPNQALSYLVFERDRVMFETKYPTLRIVRTEPLGNYLRYLLSGGLNFRQLVPDIAGPLVRGVESIIRPLNIVLALHHSIVLRHEP